MNNKIFAITAISTLILLLSCSGDEIIVNSDNNPNQISDIKPILKVYIENSGSMDGYMCDDCKQAVTRAYHIQDFPKNRFIFIL